MRSVKWIQRLSLSGILTDAHLELIATQRTRHATGVTPWPGGGRGAGQFNLPLQFMNGHIEQTPQVFGAVGGHVQVQLVGSGDRWRLIDARPRLGSAVRTNCAPLIISACSSSIRSNTFDNARVCSGCAWIRSLISKRRICHSRSFSRVRSSTFSTCAASGCQAVKYATDKLPSWREFLAVATMPPWTAQGQMVRKQFFWILG